MEISGDYTFNDPIDKVWGILMNRDALQSSLPGCEKFDEVEPNVMDVIMKVGVGVIKGTYNGRIIISDIDEPRHYKLIVSGQGGAGFLSGEGTFDLSEDATESGTQTLVKYTGKANVGGTLAGIGARMLSPVARKLAGDFFKNMEKKLQAQTNTQAQAT